MKPWRQQRQKKGENLEAEYLVSLRWQERTNLAIGILHGDLSISKSEQITAVYFDAATVRSCARERPLGNPSIA